MDIRLKQRQPVDWLDLPLHIQSLISDRLVYIKDFIRFGAVCHSWYSIYTQNRNYLPRQPPLLMFSTNILNCQFYDPSHNTMHSLAGDPLLNTPVQFLGSTQGWIVFRRDANGVIVLLNPFLSVGNKISLPRIRFGEIRKLVLSANPVVNPNYIVMAADTVSNLAVYKPGDTDWTYLDCELHDIHHIIYQKDRFYVASKDGVIVCDATSCNVNIVFFVPPLGNDCLVQRLYLVESAGDLLQVRRVWKWRREGGRGNRAIIVDLFEVFQLDKVDLSWSNVKNLCGRTLFVDDNTSVSLFASDFPGCKPNCIYFTDETTFEPYDRGVYNLENGYSEQDCLMNSTSTIRHPFWIEPTISGLNTCFPC